MTPEERRKYEAWQLEQLREQENDKSLLGKGINTLDVLNTLGYAVGGLIESGSTITENPLDVAKWKFYGAKWKISPSESLGVTQQDTDLFSWRGAAGLALDIALDPTTYVTFGTGGAAKALVQGTEKVALSKAGVKALGGFTAKYGAESGTMEFLHHMEQSQAFAMSVKAFEGLGLRGWGPFFKGRELELISKTTLDVAGGLPGQAWISGLRTLALSGETGLRAANVLKDVEEGLARAVVSAKLGLEDRFKYMAELRRLPRPSRLGARENDIFEELMKLQYGVEHVAERRISEGVRLAKAARKAFGKKYEEILSDIIEKPVLREWMKLTPEQKVIVDLMEAGFKSIAEAEKGRGLLQTELPGYLTHLASREYLKFKEAGGKLSSSLLKPLKAYNQFSAGRKLKDTLSELNRLSRAEHGFNIFEPNPVKAFIIRSIYSEKAVRVYDFLDWVGRKYGVSEEMARMGKNVFEDAGILQLKGKYFDLAVVKALRNYLIPAKGGVLEQGIDRSMRVWKFMATIASPAYQPVNVLGAVWTAILGGTDFTLLPGAVKTVLGIGKDKVYKTALGEAASGSKLLNEAGELGVTRQSIIKDIRSTVDQEIIMPGSEAILRAFDPRSRQFILTRMVRAQEDIFRYLMYMDRILKGDMPAEAAKWAARHQGDYQHFTEFEQKLKTYGIPFWAWARFNIPLHAQYLFSAPGKMSAYLKAQKEALKDQSMPDWWSAGNLPLWRDDQGRLHYMSLPLEQFISLLGTPEKLKRIAEVAQIKASTPEERRAKAGMFAAALDDLTLHTLGPIEKLPTEAVTKWNLFRDRGYEPVVLPSLPNESISINENILLGNLVGRQWAAIQAWDNAGTSSTSPTEKTVFGVKNTWVETIADKAAREQFAMSAPGYMNSSQKIDIARQSGWQSVLSGNTTGLTIFDVKSVGPGGEQTVVDQILLTQDERLEQERALRSELSLPELEYLQNQRWTDISEEHFNRKAAIMAATIDSWGRPINAAQKEQMLYNLNRGTNLRYISIEVQKLQTAINRLEKFVRGEETRGTRQDKANVAESRALLQVYYNKMVTLKAMQSSERKKKFSLPVQRTDLSKFWPMDIGNYDRLAVRRGKGPDLLRADAITNKVRLKDLSEEYRFAVGDIRMKDKLPSSLQDNEMLFEEARRMTREMMAEYLSAGMGG